MELTNNQLTNSPVLSNVEGPINQQFVVLSCQSCQKVSLHLSRELYKSNLFMQNKANFKNDQMPVTAYYRSGYGNYGLIFRRKNKAKQSQFKPNFSPKLALFYNEIFAFAKNRKGWIIQNLLFDSQLYRLEFFEGCKLVLAQLCIYQDVTIVILLLEDNSVGPQKALYFSIGWAAPDLNKDLPACEFFKDNFSQFLQAGTGFGRYGDGIGVQGLQHFQPADIVQYVNLVKNVENRLAAATNLFKDILYGINLPYHIGIRDIDNVQQQVGQDSFLKGCLKRSDEVMRQIFYEADGVTQEHFQASLESPLFRSRIESGKESVLNQNVGIGNFIEQCAFTGVCVTDDTNFEQLFPATDFPQLSFVDIYELLFQLGDSFLDDSSVDFELLFAGTSGADAAYDSCGGCAAGTCNAVKVRPHSRQTRIGVFELGEVNLQLCLPCFRTGGEDVEDELAAVNDLFLDNLLEVANLGRREVIIKDDDICFESFYPLCELCGLSRTDIESGIYTADFLLEPVDDDGTGTFRKSGKLGQIITTAIFGQDGSDQNGPLPADSQGLSEFFQLQNLINKPRKESLVFYQICLYYSR